jgi:very-short-patch-repair endonuclease
VRTPRPWTLPTQPVTRALLVASGVTDAMIRTQLATGRLTQLRAGVFLGTDAWPDTPSGRHLARAHAEQVANPDAVISHESAAVVWGLPTPGFDPWHESPVSLTRPGRTSHRSRSSTATWHSGSLPVASVTRDRDGYAVTSVARTAVDLAAGRALPESLVIVDAASRLLVASFVGGRPRRADYSNPRLVKAARESLVTAARPRDLTRLRGTVDLAEACRESPAESLTAGHIQLAGLPRPQFQATLETPMGKVYPDLYWPEANLIGECDGAIKYAEANAFVNEKEREQMLRDLGYRIVRWLAKEIMTRPWEVIARIERALGY